ncbi:MAG: alpha/beta hydrolase [bacterium]|nr:alpha/beta hydrolase [bacterium]
MKKTIALIFTLLCLICCNSVSADELAIKVNSKAIKLPYWPAQTPHYGGILIVSGGDGEQCPVFLADFAQKLASNGWSTALLNCNSDASAPWPSQLPEAISSLRKDKNTRIVLIHYGEQLNSSLSYFSKPQAKSITGFVLLSAYDDEINKKTSVLHFPLLDIIGQFDYDQVINQSKLRKNELEPLDYLLEHVPGADHEYEYSLPFLVAFLHGWMMKLPEASIQAQPVGKSH